MMKDEITELERELEELKSINLKKEKIKKLKQKIKSEKNKNKNKSFITKALNELGYDWG